MRVVIVGAGMTGLAVARLLAARGVDHEVLDGAPGPVAVPRPFMLPFQGFACLRAAGVLDRVRALGWDIAPRPEGDPVAVSAPFVAVHRVMADGVAVRYGHRVTGLVRSQGGDRVNGLRVETGSGPRDVPADLVVACDGVSSRVRGMAGIPADLTPAEGAHLSFLSPVVIDRPFAMAYQSDGRQVGLLGWPEGSAGWWDIDRVGREAALAPGVETFRRAFAALLPEAGPALAGVTSMDQVTYREITEVRCPLWFVPGVVVAGDAAHFLGPEAGLGAGLGLNDALALAEAIAANAGDPDGACRHYEHWHRPAVRPYEDIGARGARIDDGRQKNDIERWPPL